GRNGAGKTTLLRIATGFLDPDAGEVIVDGIAMARQRARAQARLGYLPEHAPAPGELTVREHLYLRARQKRAPARGAGAVIDRAIALAGLGDVVGQRIATLSKGFRQRVGLADALLGDPPLVILDEPTSGMDPIQVVQLRRHLTARCCCRATRSAISSRWRAGSPSCATARWSRSTPPRRCAGGPARTGSRPRWWRCSARRRRDRGVLGVAARARGDAARAGGVHHRRAVPDRPGRRVRRAGRRDVRSATAGAARRAAR